MTGARVLFLLTQSLDYPSGLGRYWPLARHMRRLGYEVEIVALHPAWLSKPQPRVNREGVTISYVGQMHVRQEGSRRLYFTPTQLLWVSLWATVALASAALSSRAEIIHIAKAQPLNGLAGWLAASPRRKRLYLDCDDYEAASNNFSARWQRRVVMWWEDHLPPAARGVTVNTTFLRERCLRLGVAPERVRLVPNGFDPDRFLPASKEEREAIRKQWGLGNNPVALYVGSLSLQNHPVLLLLDAFVYIHRQLRSAKLLLVGGGEDYDQVMHAIQARELQGTVIMTGRVEAMHIRAFYAASDVTVDPVADDDVARARSPLKLVESLACGVPVVTGKVGDREQALAEGLAGVLVEPGNAAALADGILSVLTNRAYQMALSAQARQIGERFRWDRLVHEFVRIYEL